MNKNTKALAGLIVLVALVLIVFYAPRYLESNVPICTSSETNCPLEQYMRDTLAYIPAIALGGVVFGLVVAYLYFERKLDIPMPSADRRAAVLSMLHPSEAKVVGKILDSGGKALQADVSRVEGLGKVKAHRVIERLMARGVVEKEQYGKTNILRLKKGVFDAIDSAHGKQGTT